jgi:hypothetical protein
VHGTGWVLKLHVGRGGLLGNRTSDEEHGRSFLQRRFGRKGGRDVVPWLDGRTGAEESARSPSEDDVHPGRFQMSESRRPSNLQYGRVEPTVAGLDSFPLKKSSTERSGSRQRVSILMCMMSLEAFDQLPRACFELRWWEVDTTET